MWTLEEEGADKRFLIHDNDSKFTALFDTIFQSEGLHVIHTPFQAPNANAYAERWVRSGRDECLDHLLILNEVHLWRVLNTFTAYYNTRRPRSTDLLNWRSRHRPCCCKLQSRAWKQAFFLPDLDFRMVRGQTERGLELHALACTQPNFEDSRWFADVVGRHIEAAAETLSPEVAAEARKRGEALDGWQTVEELLDQLRTQ